MALNRCQDCGTLFAVGAPACPQCHGTRFHEEGQKPEPKPRKPRKAKP